MNKDFEKEYKKLIEEDPPKLWDRIEKMVNAAIAEGEVEEDTSAEEIIETPIGAESEAGEKEGSAGDGEMEASAVDAEMEASPDATEKSDAESDTSEEEADNKTVILGAFAGTDGEKGSDAKADEVKKKKVFNWRRWVLPAAALLCVAIMIPVVISINKNRTKTATQNFAATAGENQQLNVDEAMMADSAMAAPAGDMSASAGATQEDTRSADPQYKTDMDVNSIIAGSDSYEIVVEEPGEEAEENDEDEYAWDDEEYDEEDEDYEDEDEEEEEELVLAYIFISVDEDTSQAVINEIASQYGLSNMGYDEEFDEYKLAVSEAMTEEALDELVDAISENENVWCVYWDYADES